MWPLLTHIHSERRKEVSTLQSLDRNCSAASTAMSTSDIQDYVAGGKSTHQCIPTVWGLSQLTSMFPWLEMSQLTSMFPWLEVSQLTSEFPWLEVNQLTSKFPWLEVSQLTSVFPWLKTVLFLRSTNIVSIVLPSSALSLARFPFFCKRWYFSDYFYLSCHSQTCLSLRTLRFISLLMLKWTLKTVSVT